MLDLDKNARKVLKYFVKHNTEQTTFTIALNANLKVKNNDTYTLAKEALDDLLELHFIKITKQENNNKFYKLTNKGRMYSKKMFSNIFYKYFYPILTALISLLLSLWLKS